MKRLLSTLGVSVLLLGLAPAVTLAGDCYVDPVHQYSGTGRVKSGVFLRNQACVEGSSILVTLSAGATVNVIGFTDGWYRVEHNGARGWVGQQFIETGAQRTGTTWSSYTEYMAEYPSRGPSPAPAPTPAPAPAPSGETAYAGAIDARNLIKLVCPSIASADHPCKAVYYIGADGKRHAFPNSRVFFTWYGNFDSVRAVTAERLGQYMLGMNATYRPGARMVKFTTDPKVYAVARGGVLRWVKTEELARAYYGSTWNMKIDDIPDAFYTNYTFGTEIDTEADFNPTAEMEANETID
ncbi:SH3 domain-containing protein [Patescibacteria group bacterium]|jgi:hypothetical protein|nr:SH3 domain-containing protein [Patescibacteria group bacterium]